MSRLLPFTLLVASAVSVTSFVTPSNPILRVEINIPAARLEMFADNQRMASHPVAVGTAKHPTPTGQFAINEITWHPWWIPPESDWARDEKPLPPGPKNPMGDVKLQFAPLYFIHGTPDSASIGRPGSHGCVRMYNADAVVLARTISALQPSPLPVGTSLQTRAVRLPNPVTVIIRYDRVEADDSTVTLHPDPYARGAPDLSTAKSIIERSGAGVVDEERLAAFLTLPPSGRFTVSRSSLLINH